MTDADFWNGIAAKYAARPVDNPDAYEKKLEMTRAYMPEGATVLEYGCGTGTTALWHAPRAGHIRAIDVADAMIAIARDKAAAAGVTNVTFETAGIEDLDAPDASFDMVMAHSILHLLPDRDAAIARSFRLLKPGGYFVSSTACLDDGLWFVRPVIWAMRKVGKAPRVWFFTSDNLRKALRAADFEIVEDWSPSKRSAAFIVARKPPAA